MMFTRRSRMIKIICAVVGTLCLAVGIVALAAGITAMLKGNADGIAAAKDGLTRAVYVISVYLTPVFAALSVTAFLFAGTGLRCGSLEKTVTRLCASAAIFCTAAFVTWLIIL